MWNRQKKKEDEERRRVAELKRIRDEDEARRKIELHKSRGGGFWAGIQTYCGFVMLENEINIL